MRTLSLASILLAALLVPLAAPGWQSKPAISGADSLEPLPAEEWDYAKARHLLSRAGFGGTPEEVERLHKMGLDQAVESLLSFQGKADEGPAPPEPPQIAKDDRPASKLTPEERQKAAQEKRRLDQQYYQQVRAWWVRRMVESQRPLEEKLVLFWHGHFATEHRTVRDTRAMLAQNQLFRKNAAGNFGVLLHGIVHDPAMLRYLDNHTNVKGRPNENLGRELLELFSMGEGQGYTEQDIKEGARALTGNSFDREQMQFRFIKRAHDAGKKTIFGRSGEFDGDQLVDLVLEQPATPRFIATKLFVYFVHDHPDAALIDQLAGTLKRGNYELAPFLKTLFRSREFYAADTMGTQIKSPVQLVVGSLRMLGVRRFEPPPLLQAMRVMGQDLMEPPNVKGWEGGRTWVNTNALFARENFVAQLIAVAAEGAAARPPGKQPGKKADRRPTPMVGEIDLVGEVQKLKLESPEAIVDHFTRALLVTPLSPERRAELVELVRPLPPASEWSERSRAVRPKLASLLVLIMTLPEYQMN